MSTHDRPEVPENLRATLDELLKLEASGAESGYTLRMFWLGRSDKFASREVPALDWLTRTFSPPQVLAQFDGFKRGEVAFPHDDHQALARQVMASARLAMTATEPDSKPPGHKRWWKPWST